jgi:formylmethanofuran dehydrogenase subunit B
VRRLGGAALPVGLERRAEASGADDVRGAEVALGRGADVWLVRGDNDAALILGADPGATMPQPAIDHLARIPTIVLDPKVTHTSRLARVHITTAATGIIAPGTVYRMDEIPLPLRPPLKSPYPTDEEVVRRIYRAVAARPPLIPLVMLNLPTA